jgi:molybdenum cofactor synthesis domain-containing protein
MGAELRADPESPPVAARESSQRRICARQERMGYIAAMPTAGILIVGNEILSGKVVDTNSPYLCRELRALGVDVLRIVTIPDEIDTIATHVREMSCSFDLVFTSGGIGPTHDDLTIDGVAAAFGRPLERSATIEERLTRANGQKPPTESQLKMAMIPMGAVLLDAGDLWFPLVIVENVHIFPGIPSLLHKKFESARERFRGVPFVLKKVFVNSYESEIAEELNGLLARFPQLMLGSYPRVAGEEWKVQLTLESRDASYVQRALDDLLRRLPAAVIHRVE